MNLRVFTDGACNNSPVADNAGGWAFIITNADTQAVLTGGYGPSAAKTTSNRMELMAIRNALRKIPAGNNVEIITDSKFCRDTMHIYYPNWMRYGWKTKDGNPVKNKQLIQLIAEQMYRVGRVDLIHQHRNTRAEQTWCDKYAKLSKSLTGVTYYGKIPTHIIYPTDGYNHFNSCLKKGDLIVNNKYEHVGLIIREVIEILPNSINTGVVFAEKSMINKLATDKHYTLDELEEKYMPFIDFTNTFVQRETINA